MSSYRNMWSLNTEKACDSLITKRMKWCDFSKWDIKSDAAFTGFCLDTHFWSLKS